MFMRTTNWMMLLLAAGLLAVVGCGKEKPPAPVQQEGKLDLVRLREAFASGSPEAQKRAGEVIQGVQSGKFMAALEALDLLANTSGLTDAQRTALAEVTPQIRQMARKSAVPRPK